MTYGHRVDLCHYKRPPSYLQDDEANKPLIASAPENLLQALGRTSSQRWLEARSVGLPADPASRQCASAPAGHRCSNGTRHYEGRGVMRELQPEMHQLVIEHEDITGFRPAMTMNFDVADPKLLAEAKPGEAVDFDLSFDGRSYRITRLSPRPGAPATADCAWLTSQQRRILRPTSISSTREGMRSRSRISAASPWFWISSTRIVQVFAQSSRAHMSLSNIPTHPHGAPAPASFQSLWILRGTRPKCCAVMAFPGRRI